MGQSLQIGPSGNYGVFLFETKQTAGTPPSSAENSKNLDELSALVPSMSKESIAKRLAHLTVPSEFSDFRKNTIEALSLLEAQTNFRSLHPTQKNLVIETILSDRSSPRSMFERSKQIAYGLSRLPGEFHDLGNSIKTALLSAYLSPFSTKSIDVCFEKTHSGLRGIDELNKLDLRSLSATRLAEVASYYLEAGTNTEKLRHLSAYFGPLLPNKNFQALLEERKSDAIFLASLPERRVSSTGKTNSLGISAAIRSDSFSLLDQREQNEFFDRLISLTVLSDGQPLEKVATGIAPILTSLRLIEDEGRSPKGASLQTLKDFTTTSFVLRNVNWSPTQFVRPETLAHLEVPSSRTKIGQGLHTFGVKGHAVAVEPAVFYKLQFADGNSIRMIVPLQDTAHEVLENAVKVWKALPALQTVERALSSLPKKAREEILEVSLDPISLNVNGGFFGSGPAKAYANFADGRLQIFQFPQQERGLSQVTAVVYHEIGHFLTEDPRGRSFSPAQKTRWSQAGYDSDKASVSGYSKSAGHQEGEADDVAVHMAVTRSTDRRLERVARYLFQARMSLVDELFSDPPSAVKPE